MGSEKHPHDKEREGSGNFGEGRWGEKPAAKPVNPSSLDSSPEWNRYLFHQGFVG